MKKTLSFLLCLVLLLACLPLGASAAEVVLSPQNLTVNGKPIQCEKYNIDGSNYFKLRDLAYLLNGTENQFGVGYNATDNSVLITPGAAYEPVGGELEVGADKSASAVLSAQRVTIGGSSADGLSIYNIGGNNFFKLRDLGAALGFNVDYDPESNTAIVLSGGGSASSGNALTSSEIYAKCSPAVFYIETCDVTGTPYTAGSGFFIDASGIAVTNHHVLEDALSATATLTDGRTLPITGVLFFDDVADYAVIKVEGSGYPALPVGRSSAVSGGEKVYAIGSPQGLQNSISDGIISNPDREGYIQTTAPISPGSSGGALINERGEVIGVTKGSIESGQNLNFAVPMDPILEGEDLQSYLTGDLMMNMSEYAELNEYIRYNDAPLAYEAEYDEYEPNDSPADAPELFNGVTVYGTVDGGDADLFLLRCNCAGSVTVLLSSDSDSRHLKDLDLLADPLDGGLEDPVWADFRVDPENGFEYQLLRYLIPKPGLYVLYIFSDGLNETEALNTDYYFYYLFTPGDTEGENSTGTGFDGSASGTLPTPSPGGAEARAAAFEGLWNWVDRNYNEIAGGQYKAYVSENGDNCLFSLIDAVADGERSLVLYCGYEYDDGSVDLGYIFLTKDSRAPYFSYEYYDVGNDGDTADFIGEAELDAASFDGSLPMPFDSVDGAMAGGADQEFLSVLAAYTFSDMLQFLEDLCQTSVTPHGAFSISDFGFSVAKLDGSLSE